MEKDLKRKAVKLKNRYTGDIFLTEDYNDVKEINGDKFIKVFHEESPSRTFLVNREAFDKMK